MLIFHFGILDLIKSLQVRDLDLSGVKTGGDIDIECFNSKFSNLETLDLSNSTITNLRGFPKLKNLKKLDMTNNRLSRGLESLKDCENLTQIILSHNKIKELDVLEPLGNLKHLTHLEVSSFLLFSDFILLLLAGIGRRVAAGGWLPGQGVLHDPQPPIFGPGGHRWQRGRGGGGACERKRSRGGGR